MLPFHSLYSWLFKSFRISGETELIEKLIAEGYQTIMIIKRSWIFSLFMLWIPLVILSLSGVSIWIALSTISIDILRYIIIGGNILMSSILLVSTCNYIRHFREIQRDTLLSKNPEKLTESLHQGDVFFMRFFDISITNQIILFLTILGECICIYLYSRQLGEHFWILIVDMVIMIIEMILLRIFRKKMMDMEMDYNIIVPGKIYFVNQSGVLSSMQTIESDKIKTVRSVFPSKIASFFDYGTIDILTEGDNSAENLGTMSMYYVTDPDGVVANIQTLLDQSEQKINIPNNTSPPEKALPTDASSTREHTLDTREKIRDVLR